jgi:hypothetical protein
MARSHLWTMKVMETSHVLEFAMAHYKQISLRDYLDTYQNILRVELYALLLVVEHTNN